MSNYKLIYRFTTSELLSFMEKITNVLETKKSDEIQKQESDIEEISEQAYT